MNVDHTRAGRGRSKAILVAGTAAAMPLILAYGAYRIVGWLGVCLLGLLMAFVAVQADMDTTAPIGGAQNTSLYTSSLRNQEGMRHAEKAARNAEDTATRKTLSVYKVLGTMLAAIGLIGFFWLQLPR